MFLETPVQRDLWSLSEHTVVLTALARLANQEQALEPQALRETPIGQQALKLIRQQRKLRFILPAFPAKSPNPLKTSGSLPDMGEVLGLMNLQTFCDEIAEVYKPGVEVIICSDGRVFNDLVLVSEEDLKEYQSRIAGIIRQFNLRNLSTFSLDECWEEDGETFVELRNRLAREYAPSDEEIRARVSGCARMRDLFNGIHRFISDDRRSLFPQKSRSAIAKESKDITYKVMQRSSAWDGLLADRFPETLRLSIHPYPISHAKFGVRLVAGKERWRTPWHSVAVRENGKFFLTTKSEALANGAQERLFGGEYVYYEI